MLFVQPLGHMRHSFQIIIEGVLADPWIFIVFLFLQSVRHEFFPMRGERIVKFLPHFVLLIGETLGGPLLQYTDLFLEVINKFMNLIDCFLLRWPLSTIDNVCIWVGLLIFLELI